MRKIIKNTNHKKILAVLSILLLFSVGSFAYFRMFSSNETTSVDVPKGEDIINLSGPTELEKQNAQEAKKTAIEEEEKRNDSPILTDDGKRSVTPVVTYGGQYNNQIEVGGYVPGVFEDGGTCTLTLEGNGTSQSKVVTGTKGASSVDCPVMVVSRDSLSVGVYQAIITYSSNTSKGSSTAYSIEVK